MSFSYITHVVCVCLFLYMSSEWDPQFNVDLVCKTIENLKNNNSVVIFLFLLLNQIVKKRSVNECKSNKKKKIIELDENPQLLMITRFKRCSMTSPINKILKQLNLTINDPTIRTIRTS